MTATTRPVTLALSANDRFKLRYPRYLKGAMLAALALTALMVWLSPRYAPQPYVLRNTEICILPDLEEPPPRVDEQAQPVPPPVLPRNVEVVTDPIDADPLEPGDWLPWNPQPPTPPADAYDGFVASSAKPVLAFFARPDYPEIARHARLEGTVTVHVLVGPDGRVIDAVVVGGVHPLLDRAAREAARRCRFRPAKQREIPVKAWLAVPYRFTLR